MATKEDAEKLAFEVMAKVTLKAIESIPEGIRDQLLREAINRIPRDSSALIRGELERR